MVTVVNWAYLNPFCHANKHRSCFISESHLHPGFRWLGFAGLLLLVHWHGHAVFFFVCFWLYLVCWCFLYVFSIVCSLLVEFPLFFLFYFVCELPSHPILNRQRWNHDIHSLVLWQSSSYFVLLFICVRRCFFHPETG